MLDRFPEHPDSLRDKARAHRSAAAAEVSPGRRRAYLLVASEYENLADAIEKEFGARVAEGLYPAADERIEP